MDTSRRRRLELSRRRALELATLAPLVLAERVAVAGQAIDESGFVRVGSIEQWIAIRGQDIRKPAIVYLRGGSAKAQSPFLNQSPLVIM
jgi:hypothetical protein